MCFAPQRRALLRHLNLQKWREHVVLCTFWLRNVLRATTVCTFPRSELPKVVRTPSVFNILTSKCASRHNGVHFFEIWTSKSGPNPSVFNILTSKCASRHKGVHFFDISTSKSGPNLVCFVHFDLQMCFAPQRRAIFHLSSGQLALHPEKHSVSRLSYLFTHLHLLSSDSFSSTLLSSNLSLLSASSLLCFSSAHIVGSLTSKLPSVMFLPPSILVWLVLATLYQAKVVTLCWCHHQKCLLLLGYRKG